MSKLKEQKALPRRKLFRSAAPDIIRQEIADSVDAYLLEHHTKPPKRKAKKAKGKR